jgi:hypothetical protein
MPPRRRVLFLLGGVVFSSILRGYSETKCLLEDVVLDDEDPVGHTPRVLMQGRKNSRRRTPSKIPLYSY